MKPAESTHVAPETGAFRTLLLLLGTELALKISGTVFLQHHEINIMLHFPQEMDFKWKQNGNFPQRSIFSLLLGWL